MKKRAITFVLALVMCLSLTVSAFADVKFTDVAANAYYSEAVDWAISEKVTIGTSETTFSPNDTCTNAHILTFLWRAYGSAEPAVKKTVNGISESNYYYKAVLWAMEKGILTGSTFDANIPCSRAMTVTYLWRAAGSPAVTGRTPFTDLGADSTLAKAVAWAVDADVTKGTSSTTFSPDMTCTRGQIVTFLYRAITSNTPKASEDIPEPDVSTDIPEPDVSTDIPEPDVSTDIPEPDVSTDVPEPDVSTDVPEPDVSTDLPEPDVSTDLPEVDFSAEYMSSSYYKALQAVVLTGDYRKDILAVASSQIGYCEGDWENQLDGSCQGNGNYSEYGRYLGSNGSAWCSEFASWCARVAKVPSSVLNSSKSANINKFGAPYYTWSQTVYAGGTYTPRPGDIALFAWYGTSTTAKNLSHTAIVYSVETSGSDVNITLIEGNANDSVKMSSITVGASTGEMKKGYLVYFVAPEY